MDSPFLPRSAGPGTPTAVVSGLGPNGVLAVLELLRCGYHVTVVEKRPAYIRPIHLHLRSSYLEDVRRLSPKLHAKLMAFATPIDEMERMRVPPEGAVSVLRPAWPAADPAVSGEDLAVRTRLIAPPVAHVRLDSLERLFYTYLNGMTGLQYGLDPAHRLTIRRGFTLELELDASGRYRASTRPCDVDDPKAPSVESLGHPDLVVLAEGGKSASVGQLGLESVRFSYPKYFMSAHVDLPFGPRTRRIDTDVRQLLKAPHLAPAEVSLWACGHGDARQGTWIVLEVPAGFVERSPEQARDYFVEGATMVLASDRPEQAAELRKKVSSSVDDGALLTGGKRGASTSVDGASNGVPFAGTFKFEQQCLRRPAAGRNVVVLGDSAGMGHHALSSGLEMGACDLEPLRRLAGELARGQDSGEAVGRYAERVYRSRITLLSLGMREYYPDLELDPVDLLHRAAGIADARANVGACEAFEAVLRDAQRARRTRRPAKGEAPPRPIAA